MGWVHYQLMNNANNTTGTECKIFKTIERNKREAKRVAKAWEAQEGCYKVEIEPFRYSKDCIVRAYLPLPIGPLPDGCYVGLL